MRRDCAPLPLTTRFVPLGSPEGEPSAFTPPEAGGSNHIRVLVACEYSATVRDAFRSRGFDAWSCDILPTEGDPRWHIQGDVLDVLDDGWDFACFHPPCTDLAVSGARHFAAKIADGRQARAIDFVQSLLDAPIPHIALENPVSVISSKIRKPDQILQPWMFGHGETKATCLWLKNLPRLVPTNIVDGREARVHRMAPGPNRWKERSRTYAGIAAAMADQWGDYLLSLHNEHHPRASQQPTTDAAAKRTHRQEQAAAGAVRFIKAANGCEVRISHGGEK